MNLGIFSKEFSAIIDRYATDVLRGHGAIKNLQDLRV